jgi:ribose/xylose/arabinose/galactoside ABC-type transport system permease subunit
MLAFAAFVLASLLFVPRFANPVNLANMLVQCADLIILACGMTFVFMNGGIDFSVTAVLSLGSVTGAAIMRHGGGSPASVAAALAAMLGLGLGIGALNGLMVTRLRMPSFIATMASQLIFTGVALWYTQSSTIGDLPRSFLWLGRGTVLGVQAPILVMAAVVASSAYVLHRTVFGRNVFAVGTNHRTSLISGIPVRRTIFSLFLLSGGLASVAAVVMTSRSGAGMPGLGKGMLMDIVGAVVIGGTAVTGGKGSILGTATGAALIIALNNSLNLLGIEWYVINALKGAMITLVALLGVVQARGDR